MNPGFGVGFWGFDILLDGIFVGGILESIFWRIVGEVFNAFSCSFRGFFDGLLNDFNIFF